MFTYYEIEEVLYDSEEFVVYTWFVKRSESLEEAIKYAKESFSKLAEEDKVYNGMQVLEWKCLDADSLEELTNDGIKEHWCDYMGSAYKINSFGESYYGVQQIKQERRKVIKL